MLEIEQQVNLFIKALDSGLALVFGCIRIDEQLLDGAKIARSINLFYLIDGTHATFAKHTNNFKFSIQDSTYWERHTMVLMKSAQPRQLYYLHPRWHLLYRSWH